MFCQTCGNKIPDDVTVCPHCGQAVSAADDMASLLSELSLALDGMEDDAQNTSAQIPIEVTFPEASVEEAADEKEMPVEEETSDRSEDSVNQEADAFGALFGADLFADSMDNVREAPDAEVPTAEPALVPEAPASAESAGKPVKAAAPKKTTSKTTSSKKAPAKSSSSKKKTAADDPGKKHTSAANTKKKKKKKKKKKGGSAVLGVIIGLLVALLLIALAAGYMLFKLGFFDSLNATDEELLYTSVNEMPSTIESTPTPTPTLTPTPALEASAVEETAASDAEEGAAAETAEAAAPAVEVTTFELKKDQESEIYLYSRGETSQISYKIEPTSAESAIEWTSDDTSVATVSDSGVIDARRGGTCTITGTCGDFAVTVSVTCSFSVPDTVLDMNYEDITMSYEGQTIQLEIQGSELSLADQNAVTWESSDESVATVNEAGLVTALADGTAVISASYEDYTASCIVRCVNVTGTIGVNSADAPYVINYEDVTLSRKGEYFQLKLTAIDNSDDPEVTWVSDDKSVATVDSKGVVTAVANGTCKVTTSIDGFNFECIVRVNIK